MIPVDKLHWKIGGADVTCVNCHTAIYKPDEDEVLCPTCRAALGEDVLTINNSMATKAARKARKKRKDAA